MKQEKETAYITKYALTEGIIVCTDGHFTENGYYSGILPGSRYDQSFFKKEFHRTLEAAKADAESRRLKKIELLKKQIQKLENLEIKVK